MTALTPISGSYDEALKWSKFYAELKKDYNKGLSRGLTNVAEFTILDFTGDSDSPPAMGMKGWIG